MGNRYAVAVVTDGEGIIKTCDGNLKVKKSDSLFVSFSADTVSLQGKFEIVFSLSKEQTAT